MLGAGNLEIFAVFYLMCCYGLYKNNGGRNKENSGISLI